VHGRRPALEVLGVPVNQVVSRPNLSTCAHLNNGRCPARSVFGTRPRSGWRKRSCIHQQLRWRRRPGHGDQRRGRRATAAARIRRVGPASVEYGSSSMPRRRGSKFRLAGRSRGRKRFSRGFLAHSPETLGICPNLYRGRKPIGPGPDSGLRGTAMLAGRNATGSGAVSRRFLTAERTGRCSIVENAAPARTRRD